MATTFSEIYIAVERLTMIGGAAPANHKLLTHVEIVSFRWTDWPHVICKYERYVHAYQGYVIVHSVRVVTGMFDELNGIMVLGANTGPVHSSFDTHAVLRVTVGSRHYPEPVDDETSTVLIVLVTDSNLEQRVIIPKLKPNWNAE